MLSAELNKEYSFDDYVFHMSVNDCNYVFVLFEPWGSE